jgi:hypothetical protein
MTDERIVTILGLMTCILDSATISPRNKERIAIIRELIKQLENDNIEEITLVQQNLG